MDEVRDEVRKALLEAIKNALGKEQDAAGLKTLAEAYSAIVK